MASIHRTPGSKTWACCFVLPDGRRAMRSTHTRDRVQAMRICAEMAKSAELAHKGRLTEDRARRTIADIYNMMQDDRIEDVSIASYLEAWLKKKRLEVAESSMVEYERLARDFEAFLGAKAKRNMDAVTSADVVRYRTQLASKVSAGTINKNLKALRGAWSQAVKDRLIQHNPFASVGLVKTGRGGRRRAFTVEELRRLLATCDQEWRGIVLTAIYTGQRLTDIATLRWSQVDLAAGEIRFNTRKTDTYLTLPIAPPLADHLMSIAGHDNAQAFLFPEQAEANQTTVSNRFSTLLDKARIIDRSDAEKKHLKDDKASKGNRRASRGLSFHSLRHTATSLLKNAGVSDVVAREIVGHKSEAVSRLYTHIDASTLRAALERMPDVTKKS